jgi:mono/diheme cytochrome c family protein
MRRASILYVAAVIAWVAGGEAPTAETVRFERDVQPILATRCFTCHGPETQKSGLRLDRKEDALRGGDSGPVIVAGDAESSLIVQLVTGQDPDRVMPPKDGPLTEAQIVTLKAWIVAGAEWPETPVEVVPAPVASEHWAFLTPVRDVPPIVKDLEWVANPIDAFVLAGLEKVNIEPSPAADKVTLVRRLHFDLIGLPPSPEDIDGFLNDESPYAYESLVNRLLASPHFGERWGRYWLDSARYADSDGYEKDLPRPYAYRYRDWVIDALNRDVPYDRFVIEQLAGDLLPNPSADQVIATGFHRNTLTNKEGGIDPEEDRVKIAVDRTNTTSSVFLGLTMGCAQCHSHKYDPISHREYYQFFSFFNTATEKDVPAALPGEEVAYREAKARFDAQVAELTKGIHEYRAQLAAKLPDWEASLTVPPEGWQVIDPLSYASSGGSEFQKLEDKSLLLTGENPLEDKYTIVTRIREVNLQSIRLEALTHESFVNGGPGRAHNGNFVLGEFTVYAAPVSDPSNVKQIPLTQAKADFEEPGHEAALAIDGDPETGWAIYAPGDFNEDRTATFVASEPFGDPTGTILTFVLDHRYGRQHNVGRVRLAVSTLLPDAVTFSDEAYLALRTPAEQRTDQQKEALLDYFASLDPKMRELKSPLEGLLKAEPQPPATKAQTMAENPDPPKTFVHVRGDFLTKGEEVQAGTPAVLPPFKARGARADRLDLARWIVDPANPLTARVQVNRVWQHLFGRGLVATPEDFGTRGERPSHPELLDWLATEYMARGWSTKDLIRLIVNSSTYRQSSTERPELLEIDPENRLLARQSRYHVEAEITRDAFLAASGLLARNIGGPSVRPPQPKDITELGYAGQVQWPESPAPDKYRRGLYIFFQRTVPYPMLMTFDCPDSNVSVVRRARSNTPTQALTLLNDPVFFECAQYFGKRMLTECNADAPTRIRWAFRRCLGRHPTDAEVARLVKFLAEQQVAFAANPVVAGNFATGYIPDGVEPTTAAAYIALARVLMNLDEFVTRE